MKLIRESRGNSAMVSFKSHLHENLSKYTFEEVDPQNTKKVFMYFGDQK